MSAEVWTFFPDRRRAESADARNRLRRECASRQWAFQERPTRLLKTRAGDLMVANGQDAVHVYRRMHRTRVAVVSIGATQVQTRPDEFHLWRLRRYCLYKAYFVRIEPSGDPTLWISLFERWRGAVHCQGDYDPRCLPHHVFSRRDSSLDSAEGRAEFDARYGSGRIRIDDEARRWALDPTAYHGTEILEVAGHQLPRGFHWDVGPGEGRALIHTPTETWRVKRYVNVYPDAFVRGRAPTAERVNQPK